MLWNITVLKSIQGRVILLGIMQVAKPNLTELYDEYFPRNLKQKSKELLRGIRALVTESFIIITLKSTVEELH